MLLSRKRDTRFQSILEGYLHDFVKVLFNSETDFRGNPALRCPVNFNYWYNFPGNKVLPSKYFHTALLGSVYVTYSYSKLVHKNMMCLGYALSYSSYFVDTSEICDSIWHDMLNTYTSDTDLGITQSELYDCIESSLPRWDDPSITIDNITYYKGVPKWLDTSNFIPIMMWNTDGYRVKLFYGYGKSSKWLNLEDLPRDLKYDMDMFSNFSLDCTLHLPDSCLKTY